MGDNLMQQFFDDVCPERSLSIDVFRSNIETVEGVMLDLPQVDMEPVHRFAEGLYCRQLTMPANTLVMSRVHKHENYAFIMSGSCTVYSEKGKETLSAPCMITTRAGTKRLLLIHGEECTWITVHALPVGMGPGTDIEELEEHYACNTLADFDKYLEFSKEKCEVLL